MYYLLIFLLFVSSCKHKRASTKITLPENASELLYLYENRLAAAKLASSPVHGWLEIAECDGMLWAGEYACGGGKPLLEYAEYPASPGKFNRRPEPYCSVETGNSATTWSRDMGMGLLIGAWCVWDIGLANRHMSYGKQNSWSMGEPYADGRAVYSPAIIGMFYQAIYKMGGDDNPSRAWPSIYSEGLIDYQAHLQMLDIWIRSEVGGRSSGDIDISTAMWDRIKEHSNREPECPFYTFLQGTYDGDLSTTTNLLIASEAPKCTYLRGSSGVYTSEWLFVARQVLERFGIAPAR